MNMLEEYQEDVRQLQAEIDYLKEAQLKDIPIDLNRLEALEIDLWDAQEMIRLLKAEV